ncbi:MAG TPA: DUF72 domain-containing protein [Polyangiaceae bacterium]|nr:DUF72 domain-containing protein [Polyangiaceae bacterium]
MMVRVGTSGFSYAGWKGAFYPAGLAASGMLGFYAERLTSVEINNTFYKTPARELLEAWAEKVPAHFRFAFKASRFFSSRRGLTAAAVAAEDAQGPLARLFGALAAVKDKLGPVLVQLPPPVKKDVPLLRDFVAALPAARRVTIEPRDPSWHSDDVYDVLRARDVALCVSEMDGEPLEVRSTATWGYFRLRKERYGPRSIEAWERRLRASGLAEAYVFFKHDESGDAAKHALALQARFGGAA